MAYCQAAHRQYIYDVHFAHWNPFLAASGRNTSSFLSPDDRRDLQYYTIEWNAANTQLKLTLLLNYLLTTTTGWSCWTLPRTTIPAAFAPWWRADLNLIKAIKDDFPDVEIQGSCLSYRITEEELQEEAHAGVSIHNPAVEIIRDSEQLKRNYLAGFQTEVIVAEGRLHRCPAENSIAGSLPWGLTPRLRACDDMVMKDPRLFCANWITIARLKQLMPYIAYVKLPRGSGGTFLESVAGIGRFIELFHSGRPYNLIDYLAAAYVYPLRQFVGYIPSHYFGDEFFAVIETCGGHAPGGAVRCAGGL